ncbi:MAG: M14 family zinc carboxypeptidase [Bacteriovoracaceae bacterium]
MKNLIVLFAFTILLPAQERYSKVEIPVSSMAELRRIDDLGIAVDHFDGEIGGSISLFLSATELQQLTRAAIPYSILIQDWNEYYTNTLMKRSAPARQTGDSLKYFSLGSKGGHFTMQEMMDHLKILKQLYPHLISDTILIGKSIENRSIIAVKISDNPNTSEPNEPEVLYTAVHHAREPQGMTGLIYYMYWLLENYNKDPEATYLVNNRQLWFIPLVNPDGYEFNGAGNMWRKNRRPLAGGYYGIDLNRNYGTYDMWNAPNGGSSTSFGSDTYRGTAPFSEPETQAIRDFMLTRNIRTCFNYHTYGNYIIYPWGYSSLESDDSLLYRQWTFDMSTNNRYSIGTDLQTVGYSTRGNSDDFMYGDTSKPRAYAMTPEIGTTGFYASPEEIIPLAKVNLLQNKLLAHYAGSYLVVRSFSVNGSVCSVVLQNNGVENLTSIPIDISISNGLVTPTIPSGDIPSFGKHEISFNFTAINGQIQSGMRATIYFKDSVDAFQKGGMINDSITFFTGNPMLLFGDSANSFDNWSVGSWGITDDGINENTFFTDSPNGNYLPNTDNVMTLFSPIDLSGYQFAELKFKTKWAIESTWDFGTVEVSTNNGSSWSTLRTNYSRKGSGRSRSGFGKQPSTAYGYDAFVPGLTWVEQSADLTPYIGKQIKVRFRLNTDGTQQRDGWYVDNICVFAYPFHPNAVTSFSTLHEYSLSQNFPNPFNPSTNIQFSVKERNQISLHIYNSIGQHVATAVDQELDAGTYSINFDAKQLSSGVYFYRFTSGTYTDIKKMAVIK